MKALTAPAAMARLGLGCGSLGSEIAYRPGCRLVEAAFEAGIRHFDVAPSYGNGMAERIVGDVLTSVRAQVTIVSKTGIAHPRGAGLIGTVRRMVVPLKQRFPGLWQRAAGQVRRTASPGGRFGTADVQASVEESLRRLRTDRLDALLLHEVQAADMTPALADLLLRWQQDGRVGQLGTGSGLAASQSLRAQYPALLTWMQTDHHVAAFMPALRQGGRLVTHRALKGGLATIASPAFGAALSRAGDAGLAAWLSPDQLAKNAAAVGDLLLRAALAQVGEGGTVLVSTTRLARLQSWVQAAGIDPAPQRTAALNVVFQALADAAVVPG